MQDSAVCFHMHLGHYIGVQSHDEDKMNVFKVCEEHAQNDLETVFFCDELGGTLLLHSDNVHLGDIGEGYDEDHKGICISYNVVQVRVFHEMGYQQKERNVRNALTLSDHCLMRLHHLYQQNLLPLLYQCKEHLHLLYK